MIQPLYDIPEQLLNVIKQLMIFSRSCSKILHKLLILVSIYILARNWHFRKSKYSIQRGRGMKWVEIISLRCPGNIDTRFIDELLKGVSESDSPTDTPTQLVEIVIYHNSVVETDLSIHIYWKSKLGSQDKSPLGLRLSSVLKPLGLLNHSVWLETAAREFVARN
jgi:hypothetical protein